ncbi:MAG TPA: RagB/SusD family nutrient uptake outer membrane protein [Puia sp.]|nr:RagB/SusD family nutrient uptake outer membrane protein [Puia sp.]
MKRIKYSYLIPGLLVLIFLLYACSKDFLNKPPIGALSPQLLANKAGVQGLLIGAYHDLTGEGTDQGENWGSAPDNWVYASVVADDAYKGSTTDDQSDLIQYEQWDALPTGSYIAQKWGAMYDGIQRANDVIRTMRLATGMSAADTTEFKAEALFLRAFFHFELRKIFWYPPFVDETITYNNNNYNVPNNVGSIYIEIWPRIEADLEYAVANLPTTQPNAGQANKYAAEAFLAKAYLYQGKYDSALTLLNDLIANGVTAKGMAYGLQANYAQNFNPNPAAKNSSESIFAVQESVNDGSGPAGGISYGDNLNFPYGGGPGACCGFDNPTQDLANAFKTDANGLPFPDGSWQSAPDVSDQSATPWTGNLDPRIDITMGRAGVPYLDWGPDPGDSWIRSPADDGHFVPKKNVYAKSVQGTYSDASSNWANVQLDAVNVNLIRYAQVLLWAAECEVIVNGNLAKAETYVNMVRNRAANPVGWVYIDTAFNASSYTYPGGTVPADSYKVAPYPAGYFTDGVTAMKAIITETRLELAEEGQRFFDLQRWQLVGNPMFPMPGSNYMTTTLDTYAQEESYIHPAVYPPGLRFITGKCEYYPIPLQQIQSENGTGAKNLIQIPGYQ